MTEKPQTTVTEAILKTGAADVLDTIANLSNDEVFTPPKLANQVLDLLPKEVWSDSSLKFLDPCVKTGVFLREIVKRLMVGLKYEFEDVQERREHILRNQIYGIAITELTALMSRRTVYCSSDATREPNPDCPENCFSAVKFEEPEGNIAFPLVGHKWAEKKGMIAQSAKCDVCGASYKDFAGQDREGMEAYAYPFIHMNIQEIFEDMQFDVVIGNPPYQLNVSEIQKSYSVPIYQEFVKTAENLAPKYLTMVIPSRWFSGGRGLDGFRSEMLADRSITDLIDYPDARSCFPGVEIKGGVCIFLKTKGADGPCRVRTVENGNTEVAIRDLLIPGTDIFVRRNKYLSIIEKSRMEESFADLVSPQTPFGLYTSFEGLPEDSGHLCKIYRNGGVCFSARDDISKGKNLIDRHKVLISKAYGAGEGFPHQIIGRPFYSEPGSACTQTYLVVGPFDSKTECDNAIEYMRTKFFRFLVSAAKNTQDGMRKVYQFVPKLDMKEVWSDERLYAHFGLEEDEVVFIESMIREIP